MKCSSSFVLTLMTFTGPRPFHGRASVERGIRRLKVGVPSRLDLPRSAAMGWIAVIAPVVLAPVVFGAPPRAFIEPDGRLVRQAFGLIVSHGPRPFHGR